jgi:uncharacterized protein
MKIFDMNVHLTYSDLYLNSEENQTSRAEKSLNSENQMEVDDYHVCLDIYKNQFTDGFRSANFMFFNSDLFQNLRLKKVTETILNSYENSAFTALINFKEENYRDSLDNLEKMGFTGIKFHPYSQQIVESDWLSILEISKEAEKRNLLIYVCTSFGTSKMHMHNGMGLACKLAEHIHKTPIILLHSGGTKIYEAMLLADDKSNVFLETSFTINYFENSPLWEDIAYAFRKIGLKRVLYGSDFPYVSLKNSFDCIQKFAEKSKFKDSEISDLMANNSINLLTNR